MLDAIDSLPRQPFQGTAWRLVRAGRDPTLGGPSVSRWCNGEFGVLYTALDKDGAIAEIAALLASQPVVPSTMSWDLFELDIRVTSGLRLPNLAALEALGVNAESYGERQYARTQAIADAANFLGFDSVTVPSARWPCLNLVAFTDRLPRESVQIRRTAEPVDWNAWRAGSARTE